MAITVYSKPNCVQCSATFRVLNKLSIPHIVIDVTEDAEAREFTLSLGYLQAPVVYAGRDQHWSGFRPDKLAGLRVAA